MAGWAQTQSQICDRNHVQAYLENSHQRNLPLYERSGVGVTEAWHIAGGGLPIWFIVRTPGDSTVHATT